jgi:hypothetical protein
MEMSLMNSVRESCLVSLDDTFEDPEESRKTYSEATSTVWEMVDLKTMIATKAGCIILRELLVSQLSNLSKDQTVDLLMDVLNCAGSKTPMPGFVLPRNVKLLYWTEKHRIIAICYRLLNDVVEYGACIGLRTNNGKRRLNEIKKQIRQTALKRYLNHNVYCNVPKNMPQIKLRAFLRGILFHHGVSWRNGIPPALYSIET